MQWAHKMQPRAGAQGTTRVCLKILADDGQTVLQDDPGVWHEVPISPTAPLGTLNAAITKFVLARFQSPPVVNLNELQPVV